jgi:hypothetical protein
MSHLPIALPHPVGWVNPVTVGNWNPLTGAWVNGNTIVTAGAGSIVFQLTYTPGAANQELNFRVETSIYALAANVPATAGEWARESIYQPGAVAAGADTESLMQREFESYTATGAVAETFIYGPVELGHVIERLRMAALEAGAPQEFGSLIVVAELYT